MKLNIGIIVAALSISFAIGSFCWTYALNEWLELAGKDARIVWWQGGLIGFVPLIGQLSIPAAVVTWIALLFI